MDIKAVVLAAGQGKRLRSDEGDMRPKVMREIGGRPLIGYVLDALGFLRPEDIIVVTGFGRESVESWCAGRCNFAVQREQLGTAHAVDACREAIAEHDGPVLVCCGDTPLVTGGTYRMLIEKYREGYSCVLLTAEAEDPYGYGRIVRDSDGGFSGIVEQRDLAEGQREIREINAGVYVFDSRKLFSALGRVAKNNAQGEYYLTDVPKILLNDGERVAACKTADFSEILGINTEEQLALAESLLKSGRTAAKHAD